MSGSGNIQQTEVAVAREVLLSLRLEQTCWGRSFEGMVENASTASQLRQLTSETSLSAVFDLDFFFCISFEDLQLVQIWAGFCLDTFLTQRTDLRCVVPSVRSKPAFLGKDLPPTPFPVNFLSKLPEILGNLPNIWNHLQPSPDCSTYTTYARPRFLLKRVKVSQGYCQLEMKFYVGKSWVNLIMRRAVPRGTLQADSLLPAPFLTALFTSRLLLIEPLPIPSDKLLSGFVAGEFTDW